MEEEKNEKMKVQIVDWFGRDEPEEGEDEDEELDDSDYDGSNENDNFKKHKYVIYTFGINENAEYVSARIVGFTPFFWIELPDNFEMSKKRRFLESLRDNLYYQFRDDFIIDKCIVRKKFKFRDYQWNKPKNFLQLVFASKSTMNKMYYKLQEPITIADICKNYLFPVYERNIDPILRFIHIKNISPVGWLEFSEEDKDLNVRMTKVRSQHAFQVFWKDVKVIDEPSIGKMSIASFDIEADSSHGDFPVAKKDYTKLAQDIWVMKEEHKQRLMPIHIEKWIRCAFREYEEFMGNSGMKFSDEMISNIHTIHLKNPSELENVDFEGLGIKIFGIIETKEQSEVLRILNKSLPAVKGDKVIQIGTVFADYGTKNIERHICVLGSCDDIPQVNVYAYDSVKKLIIGWCNLIRKKMPNIITGYNIFGFDFKFLYECAEEYECEKSLQCLSNIIGYSSKLVHKELSSSAIGQSDMYYLDTPGIIMLDLMKVIQREHNLSSYKLDNVAVDFINGSISNIEKCEGENRLHILTKSTFSIQKGQYIVIQKKSIIGTETIGEKRQVIDFKENGWIEIEIEDSLFGDYQSSDEKGAYIWAVGKDDVHPKDIFRLQRGNSTDRAIIAKYCVQDCELCLHLIQKLEIIANNVGMGNVCLVPFSYLFMRGQMIKTLSLVASECRKDNYLIPELPKPNREVKETYEGAHVLEPKTAIYLDDDPVSVLDYGSLYPSSMIGNNISHDTIIKTPEYLGEEGGKKLREMGLEYEDIVYDNYINFQKGKTWVKMINPSEKTVTCRFIQPPKDERTGEIINEKRGILPRILMKLLAARKHTRKLIATETNPFRRTVLDGLQLAYKITANSLYGGVGASVSALYYKDIAASTTATGRQHLQLAKSFVEEKFPQANVVYGDTDSIFVNFNPTNEKGERLKGKDALKRSIEMALEVEKDIQPLLKYPHKLEYEKTFSPFILFSKKRYIGNKYEHDIHKFKQSSMGVVTKRRDNAPIVKYVYNEIISIIINEQNIKKSIQFLHDTLNKILRGEFPIQYFVITKTLRSHYANPKQIVHKVLADRIAEREPGNKPQSNDRIPYVYIYNKKLGSNCLQGERVETPQYVIDNNLTLDYIFYITNQIMKPVAQIYSLALNDIPGYKLTSKHWKKIEDEGLAKNKNPGEIRELLSKKTTEEAIRLLFNPIVRKAELKRDGPGGQKRIDMFFKPKCVL